MIFLSRVSLASLIKDRIKDGWNPARPADDSIEATSSDVFGCEPADFPYLILSNLKTNLIE